jgi:two-component system CheB/CheR fusion protein
LPPQIDANDPVTQTDRSAPSDPDGPATHELPRPEEAAPSNDVPVVGVGASAGGIEALEGFFRGLPSKPGLGIVVVTHLSPERESRLHEIIARLTELPVAVAADGVVVRADHVYVLPADAVLGIAGGVLSVHRPQATRRGSKPIDVFFAALAADRGEAAAGVVLSGGDGDGTLGVKAIKQRGGLTLAQIADGFGPSHPDMPDSAIISGFIDFALPAEQMGARLAEFARGLRMLDGLAEQADGATEARALEEARLEIYTLLRNQVGHDFAGYKTKTFLRRVQRRMQVLGLDTVDGYVEQLRQDPQEVGALFRDLLISVTSFFRDADAFEALAATVIPRLFEGRGAGEAVRVWVPGCATGEEVFSLAILMREHMDGLAACPRVQIFATDIDDRALTVARAARYPEALLDSVSPARRQRFFIADGGSFVVAKEVRDLCIFSPHSVIRDPPFSRIDLVSCRNLLIYFAIDVQNHVLPVFHYALRPDGYLFLGTSESVGQFNDLFLPVEKKQRIFRRRADAVHHARIPIAMIGQRLAVPSPAPRSAATSGQALRQAVEGQVLERYALPFVVVNRDGEAAYFSGRTGRYLEAATGVPTRQVLTMARKGLRLDLRTALREAVETGQVVRRDGLMVEGDDGRLQAVSLTVDPLRDVNREEPLFLVLFEDQGAAQTPAEALAHPRARDTTTLQLERDLQETRDRLQSLVEEYETALEELKASNEELVSVNEELQSTNEELEASKEELQSLNEELHTVNAELSGKVEALDRANTDLHNLFESTNVATVFLDADLVIRSFTPAVTQVLRILPGDIGRPITDLASRFALPELVDDVAAVVAEERLVERRIQNKEGDAHYLVRISPYRDSDRRIRGAVLSFVDVTSLTQAEGRQRVLIAELHHRTRNLLTVVQAIASLTLGKGGTLGSFTDRLAALGRVQDLVSHMGGHEVDLAEIVGLELRAHAAAEDGRVTFGGPPVKLTLDRLQALALAVHELATNAMKYGALKQEGGRLAVRWHIDGTEPDNPRVVLEWRESGVPMPNAPPRSGYGRQLIERALAHTLGAQASLDFGEDGILCRIEVPLGRRPSRAIEGK